MSSVSKEVELKLLAPANCLDQLRAVPAFETSLQAPHAEQTLISTYYDFDDFLLRQWGLSLRVRQIGSQRIQTLKSVSGPGEIHFERIEIEKEIDADLPDVSDLPTLPGSSEIAQRPRSALHPIFETRIHRTSYRIEDKGAEIEMALDTGEVVSAGSTVPVSEIELELKSGDVGRLFQLAQTISTVVPVKLGIASKAELGYRLVNRQQAKATVAPPVSLTPELTTAEAFKVIARSCLHHLIANRELVLSHDPKAIHQARVALRRFRVAISTFSQVVSDDQMQEIKNGLKHFARQLAPARDLDVLIDGILRPFRNQHPKDRGATSLLRSFRRQRLKAYTTAAKAIRSAEFDRFLIDCAAWIDAGLWTKDADPARTMIAQQPVAHHAAERIAKRRKQCRSFGAGLVSLSDEDRHQLRISVKKLRYTVEFFESLYASSSARQKRMRRFLRTVQQAQDSLGALNDLATRHALFADLRLSKRAGALERAFSAGMLLGTQESEIPVLEKTAAKALRKIQNAKSFWKLSAAEPGGSSASEPPSASLKLVA